MICYRQTAQELLRTLREKKSALDTRYQEMEQRLDGLPELVKQALDHAAQLQREADSLAELVSLLSSVLGGMLSLYLLTL